MSTTIPRGNVQNAWILGVVFDPASVAAATSVEQSITVPGVRVGDYVDVTKPTLTAGLSIGSARVSAANTVAVTFSNATAGALDPGSETYQVYVMRPDGVAPSRVPGS